MCFNKCHVCQLNVTLPHQLIRVQFISLLKFVTLLNTHVRETNIKIPFLSVLCFYVIRILITFSKADFVFKRNGTLKNMFIDNNLNQ